MGRRLALVIASYAYQDPGLRRLTSPAHDAESFAAVLRDPQIAGFEVTALINEPHHRVGEAIGDLYRDRRRDDLTLLYFTGHGLKDDNGRLFLAMANTRRDSLLFTSLSAEQIDHAMEGCASRQKVLILDCCYSGAFPSGHLAKGDPDVHSLERFRGRGRTVLTASDSTQYSFEGNRLHGEAAQSVFTRYLVEGLRNGQADLDGDGDITVDELYSYVHERVVEEMPQQRPKKQDDVEGRIVIAQNINWSLPTHLRNALGSPIASDRLGALEGLTRLHRIGNDVVRTAVRDEIERLVDDDSKLVSTAASVRLRSLTERPSDSPRVPEPQVAGPIPAPSVAADAVTSPDPEPFPSGADPVAPPERFPAVADAVTSTEHPVDVVEVTASTEHPGADADLMTSPADASLTVDSPGDVVTAGAEVGSASTESAGGKESRSAMVSAGRPGKAMRAVRAVGRHIQVVAGVLAVLAGVLLAVGEAAWHGSLAESAMIDDASFFSHPAGAGAIMAWYTAGMAMLAVVAAALTLLPRTRSLIGPGFLIGAGAASVWGLAFFAGDFKLDPDFGGRLWVEPVGYAILLLAAFCAGLALWRDPAVRFVLAMPRAPVRRSVFVLAFFGASLLLGQLAEVAAAKRMGENLQVWVAPFFVVAVLALFLPAGAVTSASRRLELSLLGGWIAGGTAIFATGFALVRGSELLELNEVVGFGCTLLLLLAAGLWLRVADPTARPSAQDTIAASQPASPSRSNGRVGFLVVLALMFAMVFAGSTIAFYDRVPVLLTSVAASPDGRRLYVIGDIIASGGTRMWTVDTATNLTVGQPIVLGNGYQAFYQMAVTPDGRRAYVTRHDTNTVRVVDLESNTAVGKPIPVGKRPADVAVAPDGKRVYVSNSESGTVSVIDTATNTTIGQSIPVGQAPKGLVVSPDGHRVYVADSGSNQVSVIDTATNTNVGKPIPVANRPGGLAISPDGLRLYVSTGGIWNFTGEGVTVIDTATGKTIGKPFDLSIDAASKRTHVTGWSGITVSPEGGWVYVTNGWSNAVLAIDTLKHRVSPRPIKVGAYALGIAANPNGHYVYAATAVGVSIIDAPAYESELTPIFE
ncbi:40-residue YVTN family beta-propeller repeat-containing protein [Streptosporangium subroseum]|uniref:40-residue YVTN family beta-propeller repeat-containing protein n=1 Tax=Streptosporangium subroseum TaxID=106412 RepID=A0A239EPX1_9ACTN|nr:caspase family protein [Streptosporangium subroseum]SNS46716.1 40-residue YVTN family beta-propeller repeat-containing protein [Streptosporangium subroseum]